MSVSHGHVETSKEKRERERWRREGELRWSFHSPLVIDEQRQRKTKKRERGRAIMSAFQGCAEFKGEECTKERVEMGSFAPFSSFHTLLRSGKGDKRAATELNKERESVCVCVCVIVSAF
jgi:hypothetical protein